MCGVQTAECMHKHTFMCLYEQKGEKTNKRTNKYSRSFQVIYSNEHIYTTSFNCFRWELILALKKVFFKTLCQKLKFFLKKKYWRSKN